MNKEKIVKIFERFKKRNPDPTTELHYSSDFELLIAVILSARATDKSVNKVTEKLFKKASTPREMLNLGESGLKEEIKTIGLYKTKAQNILKTCAILQDEYQGSIPEDREGLEKLPGVGRKTANVILNSLFDEPVIAVDTHVSRVANRIGLTDKDSVRQIEEDLMKVIPKKYLNNAHHWLILHGRYICVARNPKCSECFINDLCEYEDKNWNSLKS